MRKGTATRGDRGPDPATGIGWHEEEFRGGLTGKRWHARLPALGTPFWVERWVSTKGVKQPYTLICHGFGYRRELVATTAEAAKTEALAFAKGHRDCPEVSTEASRKAAQDKVYNAAFARVFGL